MSNINREKKSKKFEIPKSPFIEYLETLVSHENRGALAALRRGLQHQPGTCIDMYPYVIPWIHKISGKWEKDVYYLIAALFAYHPSSSHKGNMGDILRKIYDKRGMNPSIEQRFTALLKTNPEDLHFHMRQTISLAKSENIPINWNELFYDLKRWSYGGKYPPYEKWAQSFWKRELKLENIENNKNKKR